MINDNYEQEEECIKGDPWSVVKIKTRKYARECIEMVLSKRNITELENFDKFPNLEALWLNYNRLTEIKGLETNFRIKILSLSNNRIKSITNSSILCMKFLEVLYLNNNKLKNLEVVLDTLKNFSFLKNLNLFGNPISEEPEYRPRVIDALKSLEIFDRHKISIIEKIKAETIVKEYHDPLSKKKVIRIKRPKVYENYSLTEKYLYNEVNNIIKRDKKIEEEKQKISQNVEDREKYPNDYIPYNSLMTKNMEKYYDKKVVACPELEDNEMNRLFSKYDTTGTGMIKKDDIQLIFFDIKDILEKRKVEFNENKLINHMLQFYASSPNLVSKDDIKKCYGKILHEFKSNMLKDKVLISDLEYLKKLATNDDNAVITATQTKVFPSRRDIFNIKCITDKQKREVILNENKLAKI